MTQIVTSDNCKVAVTRDRDWVDPLLNRDFQAWAEHNPTVLQRKDLTKYTKKVRYYSKIPLLFMDVFAINRYPKETDNILYHLVTR